MNSNTIKIAIAGVGNLTAALAQAIEYYREGHEDELMYPRLGGFGISDIEIVAAFDIDKRKVGKDFSEAIFAPPNNSIERVKVPNRGITVHMGPIEDGISEYTEGVIEVSDESPVDITEILENTRAELLVLNTPSGSDKANDKYAAAALEAGCGLINSTPSDLVREGEWARKFAHADLPILGDDLQSQAGGTIFHKGVLEVLHEQGIRVADTYQLDVSGGLEGLTTLDYGRRMMKRKTKEDSIKRSLPYGINIAAGTTDYLDFLGSRRIGHYWIKAKGFMGHEVAIDIRMKTDDGINGAASLVDGIRAAKVALARAVGGPVKTVCAHLFKAPPSYLSRTDAIEGFEEFISGERES